MSSCVTTLLASGPRRTAASCVYNALCCGLENARGVYFTFPAYINPYNVYTRIAITETETYLAPRAGDAGLAADVPEGEALDAVVRQEVGRLRCVEGVGVGWSVGWLVGTPSDGLDVSM